MRTDESNPGDLIRLQSMKNASIIDGILIMETMKNMALCHKYLLGISICLIEYILWNHSSKRGYMMTLSKLIQTLSLLSAVAVLIVSVYGFITESISSNILMILLFVMTVLQAVRAYQIKQKATLMLTFWVAIFILLVLGKIYFL